MHAAFVLHFVLFKAPHVSIREEFWKYPRGDVPSQSVILFTIPTRGR
jgi:hypothetical protein